MSGRFVRSEEERRDLVNGNILKMMKLRGYIREEDEENEESEEEEEDKEEKKREDINGVFILKEESKYNYPKKIYVYKADNSITESDSIRKLIAYMEKYKLPDAIFIRDDKFTSKGKNLLSNLSTKYSVTQCLSNEFIVDFSKMTRIEHQLLTQSEKIKILSEGESNPSLYPVIYKSDPPAKYKGAKPKDMFRIIDHYTRGNKIRYRYTR